MLDSSVYFRGDVKRLVYPLLACSEPHTQKNSGLIFHFGLSFKQRDNTGK